MKNEHLRFLKNKYNQTLFFLKKIFIFDRLTIVFLYINTYHASRMEAPILTSLMLNTNYTFFFSGKVNLLKLSNL